MEIHRDNKSSGGPELVGKYHGQPYYPQHDRNHRARGPVTKRRHPYHNVKGVAAPLPKKVRKGLRELKSKEAAQIDNREKQVRHRCIGGLKGLADRAAKRRNKAQKEVERLEKEKQHEAEIERQAEILLAEFEKADETEEEGEIFSDGEGECEQKEDQPQLILFDPQFSSLRPEDYFVPANEHKQAPPWRLSLASNPFSDYKLLSQSECSFTDPLANCLARELSAALKKREQPLREPRCQSKPSLPSEVISLPPTSTRTGDWHALSSRTLRQANPFQDDLEDDEAPPLPRRNRPLYIEWSRLGSGGQGTCDLVRQPGPTGVFLVRKRFHASPHSTTFIKTRNAHSGADETVDMETYILRDVLVAPHENIARLVDSFSDPHHGATELFFEYCDGGDLHGLIRQYRARTAVVPEAFVWHVFLQLAKALAYLHSGIVFDEGDECATARYPLETWHAVLHRDLKPANILLSLPAAGITSSGGGGGGGGSKAVLYPTIKLADFGMSSHTASSTHRRTFHGGTVAFQPPELPLTTEASDMWALGAVVHALCHGGLPPIGRLPSEWDSSPANWRAWEANPYAREMEPLAACYSDALDGWMARCLDFDHEARVKAWEAVVMMGPEARARRESGFVELEKWGVEGGGVVW
ncbi:MAG: hypothetical protein M1819_006497 [Sarea resinae]|nr:MAG: hypothetical protein M1819_006497 [Sarea resinae]